MSMEPVAPLLGFWIGHPNYFCRASQVRLGDPNRADPVVVGVCFFEFAHLATFQHQAMPFHSREGSHDVKAVARGFNYKLILRLRVLSSPTPQLSQWNFVEHFLDDRLRRRRALEQRCSES